MLLNLLLGRHARLKQWIDQVLENLPEEKKVVALRDYEVHGQEVLRRPLLVKELLQPRLILERDRLVDVEHLEHELLDVLDAHHLKGLVEQLDQVARRTRKVVPIPVDLNLVLQLHGRPLALGVEKRVPAALLPEDIDHDLDQRAVDLDRVGVAKSDESIVKGVIATSKLVERAVVLVSPVDELKGLVRIQVDRILLPVVFEELEDVHVGEVHVKLHNVGSLLRLGQTGVKCGNQVVSHLATGVEQGLKIVVPVDLDVKT